MKRGSGEIFGLPGKKIEGVVTYLHSCERRVGGSTLMSKEGMLEGRHLSENVTSRGGGV